MLLTVNYSLKCINGIRWGGDFAIEDPIHIDDKLNIITPALWKRHYQECQNDFNNAIWQLWR